MAKLDDELSFRSSILNAILGRGERSTCLKFDGGEFARFMRSVWGGEGVCLDNSMLVISSERRYVFFFFRVGVFLNLLLIRKFFISYNFSDRNGIGENNYWSFSKGRSG